MRKNRGSGIIPGLHPAQALGPVMHNAPQRCCLVFAFLVLAMTGHASPADPVNDTGRPLAGQGPTPVELNIFLIDLDAIDSAAQSFQANVYFEAKWKDPRLADTSKGRTGTLPLDSIWNPRLQILNQQRLWSTLPDIAEVAPDGTVTQRARVWGDFSQPLDLRDFPFDNQKIRIDVVAAGYDSDEVKLVAGTLNGIGKSFSIADWRVVDWHIETDIRIPGPKRVEDPGAGIGMVVETERLRGYYWIKVIAPLILIVAMSWAVNWIDPKDIGTKISITITAMLTLIAYRFAIGATLPQISYLTRMDLFILFSTILIYASLVNVITTAAFSRKGRPEIAKRIDQVSRWGFPLFFVASWVVGIMLPT